MIEENKVWSVRCDKCGKIIESFDSEEEARQRISPKGFQGNKYLFRANVCVFCEEVVCNDCQANVTVQALYMPVCKKCAAEHTIAELEEKYWEGHKICIE